MGRYFNDDLCHSDELYHFGIKGQKWGRRRFQNEDGTLTPEGRNRYKTDPDFRYEQKKVYKKMFDQMENEPNSIVKKYNSKNERIFVSKDQESREAEIDRLADLRRDAHSKHNLEAEKKYEKDINDLQKRYAKEYGKKYSNPGNYNNDGSRKYSAEIQRKLDKNKAPMNSAEKALNIASLGSYQAVKSAEMRYQGQSERSRKNVSKNSLALRGMARGASSYNHRLGVQMGKTLAACGATAVYELSGRNPNVKKGAIIVGKAVNAAGNLSTAMVDGYNIYAQVRDTKNAYSRS